MIYNPLDENFKSVIGGIETEKNVKFKVNVSANNLYFNIREDSQQNFNVYEMQAVNGGFEFTLNFNKAGLFWYYFSTEYGACIGKGVEEQGEFQEEVKPFQLTVFGKNFKTPNWIKGGIMYQIFPDRFAKIGEPPYEEGRIIRTDWGGTPTYKPNEYGKVLNNDFFGGNFKGIQEKLTYLKEIGVSVIYLNPIYKAYSNHRYDCADYKMVDSALGSEEDFENLIKTAKKKGIKIILDIALNHTGSDSRYFNKYNRFDEVGAYQSKNSVYRNWYYFTGGEDEYLSWWGIDTLPKLNLKNQSLKEYLLGEDGVLNHYLKKGIDGFRLDVADELDEDFLKELRKTVKKDNEDNVIIGEVWEDASNKISYGKRREYFLGEELDSVMNYPLKNAIIDLVLKGDYVNFLSVIRSQLKHYPKNALDTLMNSLSTHDTARILTVLGGESMYGTTKDFRAEYKMPDKTRENAIERLKNAIILQFTLYGVPCIYYGDELGMEGCEDPFNRRCFEFDKKDEKVFEFTKKIAKIRNSLDVFKEGALKEVYSNNGVIILSRANEREEVFICINYSNDSYNLNFTAEMTDLITNETATTFSLMKNQVKIIG